MPRTFQHELSKAELYKPVEGLGNVVLTLCRADVEECCGITPSDEEMERISKRLAEGLMNYFWDVLYTVVRDLREEE